MNISNNKLITYNLHLRTWMAKLKKLFEESIEKKSNSPLKNKSSSLYEINSPFTRQSSAEPGRDPLRSRAFTITEGVEFSFRDSLKSIRNHIKCKFQYLKGLINQQEDKMMEAIDEIEQKYARKHLNIREKIEELNNIKAKLDEIIKENSLQAGINSLIDKKYSVNEKKSEVCVTLQWPTAIESSLHQLEDALIITEHDETSIPIDPLSPIDAVRIPSLQSFGRMGQGFGEMVSPRAITISKDGNLYCTDWENNMILTFTPFGEFIHAITDVKHPYGVQAHGDRLYVTEANNSFLKVGKVGNHACIKAYDLSGNLINKAGKWGSAEGCFKSPSGLTIHEKDGGKDELFVCDTDNNRLQIFNTELEFKSVFVQGKVKQPDDVKVQDMLVYVLDKSNPCLHIFTYKGESIANIISQGPGRDIESSFFFTLDRSGLIILGDHDRHCIKVFTPSGKLARCIGRPNSKTAEFCLPLGIAYSMDDQMAVVSLRQTGCIQLFSMNLSVFSL